MWSEDNRKWFCIRCWRELNDKIPVVIWRGLCAARNKPLEHYHKNLNTEMLNTERGGYEKRPRTKSLTVLINRLTKNSQYTSATNYFSQAWISSNYWPWGQSSTFIFWREQQLDKDWPTAGSEGPFVPFGVMFCSKKEKKTFFPAFYCPISSTLSPK